MRVRLVEQINLTPLDNAPSTYLIKFSTDTLCDYQPGDWLTVKGRNPEPLVQAIISLLNLNPADSICLPRQEQQTILQVLRERLEITTLDPAVLNRLVRQYGFDQWENRAQMQAYAQSRDIVDLLNAFPRLIEMGQDFLSLLSSLAPRYYSIASSPANCPNEIHLLYKAVRYHAHGREHLGVTSTTMAQAQVGDVFEVEIKPNAHFKLPKQGTTPIIMLAAGTGLAPFIGFMQQREADNASGENYLVFGETHQQTRFLCQADLTRWQQLGLLRLETAFSRDQAHKVYVQDCLAKNQHWLTLWQAGAHLYICGDKLGLAKGVEQQIKQSWCEAFDWDMPQADQAWLEAKKQQRIQLDVY